MQRKTKGEIGIEGLDLEEEARLLKAFTKDCEWMLSQEESLRREYPKKIIAIRSRKVVASSNEYSEICAKLKEMGVDPKSTLIKYVPEKRLKYLLHKPVKLKGR